MRALLVAAAPVESSAELVQRLAAKSGVIIAVDAGGAVCLDAGVLPDVVLGDFDSIAPEHLERLTEAGVSVVWYPPKKDATDLELAVAEARHAGATELVVTCATSGRLDHTLAAIGALIRAADLRPEIEEPDLSAWLLSVRGRDSVRLGGVGATISLMALGGPAVVSASGVEWVLAQETLLPGSGLGISNIITAAEGATISLHEGIVLVMAPVIDPTLPVTLL
jgi:thiamine pyrophosphokinase